MSGPLSGLRVVEMAGIGPGPYACMLLSDLGAEVIRIERGVSGMGGQPGDATVRRSPLDCSQTSSQTTVLPWRGN